MANTVRAQRGDRTVNVTEKDFRRNLAPRGWTSPDITEDDQPGPKTAEQLENDHTRPELDDLAREAGVDNPDSLPNKTAVAEAIVSAR